MSKLRNLVKGLTAAQEALSALEGIGVDVNRLIGISNAQGPIAELIRGVMLGSIELNDPSISTAVSPLLSNRQLPPRGGSSTKRKKKSSST
jgi:hypothetical protein